MDRYVVFYTNFGGFTFTMASDDLAKLVRWAVGSVQTGYVKEWQVCEMNFAAVNLDGQYEGLAIPVAMSPGWICADYN